MEGKRTTLLLANNVSQTLLTGATLTLLAAMTSPPSAVRKALINSTIRSLQAAGIWQLLDAFYMLAAHDAQAALLNWKDPSKYLLAAVNSPTFTVDRGYDYDGTTQNLQTSDLTSWAGLTFVQDSQHAWVFPNENVIGLANANDIAIVGASQPFAIAGRNSGDNFSARGASATPDTVANTNAIGFFLQNRNNSADFIMRQNATETTKTRASSGVPTANFGVAITSGTRSDRRVAGCGFGGALSAAQRASLQSIVTNYMTAVGSPTS